MYLSFLLSDNDNRLKPGSLKAKVWEMHAQAMEYLKQGYTTMSIKAGGFRYSYFLWFEDADRNRVEPNDVRFFFCVCCRFPPLLLIFIIIIIIRKLAARRRAGARAFITIWLRACFPTSPASSATNCTWCTWAWFPTSNAWMLAACL